MKNYRISYNTPKSLLAIVSLSIFLMTLQCSSWPKIKLDQQDTWHTIEHNGKKRRYLIHKPDGYNKHAPLLLVLHGGGGKIESILRGTKGRFNQLANQHRFLVVYPEGYSKHWNDGRNDSFSDAHKNQHDDVGFIRRLISEFKSNYYIDPNRIYATGISNGGMMSQRLACQLPEIRAVASVVAQMPADLKPICKPSHPVSVMLINGTADPLVPYKGGSVTIKLLRTRKRGVVLSTDQTINFWKQHNRCNSLPVLSNLPDRSPGDSSTVSRFEWKGCTLNSKVTLIRVNGGGHTWPGGWAFFGEGTVGKTNQDFDATDTIWNFLQSLKD